ncbi:hypothetical protein RDI58_014469 [Solanum bulbocastanum]|uniref:Uncharacterized protein n=1 Tax=Solanum bulbocastanum TaxID=147425 RepID=A0AAN8TG00_SOLBU
MEEEIVILVQHSGGWDNEHNFIVDGLTLKESSNLDTILDEITKILGIYASMDTIEIKYSVKQNYTPMKIYNDRSLRWYLDLSNSIPNNSTSNSSQDMQLVQRVELTQSLMPIHGNYSSDEIEIDNRFHKYIKEGQLYMKKEILQDVVNHIAINENFQFKVKRSSSTR